MSGTGSLEEMQPLYEMLTASVPKHPLLPKVVTDVILVNTPHGYDIWVIYEAASGVEDAIRVHLRKLVDRARPFSSSQSPEVALKKEGVTIVEQMKIAPSPTSAAKSVKQSEKRKKWWQFWK
jgi:hypothetical protein